MNEIKKTVFEITAMYSIIIAIGILTYLFLPIEHKLVRLFIADILMTIVTYLFSLYKKNSSVYDAYWSVIPFLFVMIWFFNAINWYHYLTVIIVSIWSWRLTLNWYRSWTGWQHEDWRYVDFRKQHGKNFEWINFFGIHLYPTCIVFLCCTSLYYFFNSAVIHFPNRCIFGLVISFTGILLEFFADNTLYNYRNKKDKIKSDILREGLWKYSRNPNYLGEMLFWIGIAIVGNSGIGAPWWTILGAIGMVLMFLFASIPMKENRFAANKPEAFTKYKNEVSMVIPWFVKKSK